MRTKRYSTFDEAIRRVQYSQHESIRYYVAEFLIMSLSRKHENCLQNPELLTSDRLIFRYNLQALAKIHPQADN